MTQNELDKRLADHAEYLASGGERGELADLSRANLIRADLSRADLTWADLKWADLKWADLTWATTSDARGIRTIGVQVTTSRENNMITYYPDLGIVTTGCFQDTMDELKAKVEEKHKDNPFLLELYRRAIAFIEAEEEAERDEQTRAW